MAMGRRTRFASIKMFLVVVLTIFAVNVASSTPVERRRRHLIGGGDESSERRPSTRSLDHSSPNSLLRFVGESQELETDLTDKKISHRLVGGHMRFDTRRRTTTTTMTRRASALGREAPKDESENKREALEADEARWEDLVVSSAGNGNEKKSKANMKKKEEEEEKEDDEEKKSLSQQVKEGKYGLIQNEIYPSRAKRPGIISYLSNPEVPRDNAKNLGGLNEEDIWLAEDHVLVLRGGNFPDRDKDPSRLSTNTDAWSPIDDYKAPKRQVKIPPSPKVPPPFPIQLTDNGPVQILLVNGTSCTAIAGCPDNESSEDEPPPPPPPPPRDATKKLLPEQGASEEPISREKKRGGGDKDQDRKIKSGHVPPRNGGIIGPFYPSLPPGAVFVVPPGNHSDYDEEDQSIYYPAPYSFIYKQENSTPVPPGPLVPGIILPPPPDFFSRLEMDGGETVPRRRQQQQQQQPPRTKYTKRPDTTAASSLPPGTDRTYYTAPKSIPKAYKSTTAATTTTTRGGNPLGKPVTSKYSIGGSRGSSSLTMKPLSGIKYKSTTVRSNLKKPISEPETIEIVRKTLVNDKQTSSLKSTELYTGKANTLSGSRTDETTIKSKSRWIASVSSKPVPLVSYYSSSTPSTIDRPIEVHATPAPMGKEQRDETASTPHQASYYFYQEANEDDTTANPKIYYRATTETPLPLYPHHLQQQRYRAKGEGDEKEQVEEENGESRFGDEFGLGRTQTAKPLDMVELRPLKKTTLRYHSIDEKVPATNSVLSTSRLKSPRMLGQVSPAYYDEITTPRTRTRLANLANLVNLRNFSSPPRTLYATTTRTTSYDYDRGTEPKAIYQYSYESADYSKRRQEKMEKYVSKEPSSRAYYKEARVASTPTPFDEWRDARLDSHQPVYDYEEGEDKVGDGKSLADGFVPYRGTTGSGTNDEDTTANPYDLYYTKQDDQLLDEVTREYFTNFGKKIRGQNLPGTTPIYTYNDPRLLVVTDRPRYTQVESYYLSNDYEEGSVPAPVEPAAPPPPSSGKTPRVKVHYGHQAQQKPYSLESDTRVNYENPLPSFEPNSEWIPGFDPKTKTQKQPSSLPLSPHYRQHQTQLDNQEYVRGNLPKRLQQQLDRNNAPTTNFLPLARSRPDASKTYATSARPPPSLRDDIDVNYRDPRPPINPDAEYIDPSVFRETVSNTNNDDDDDEEKASYFAYRLPGDSGHFYFLTPQAITQRRDENGEGYLYPRPGGTRFSRQRRRGTRNS